MTADRIWDLSLYVGIAEHLAIVDGVDRQATDPLDYANSFLSDCDLPTLTPEEFSAALRRLRRAGVLARQKTPLTLTTEGKQALERWLYWPSDTPHRRVKQQP